MRERTVIIIICLLFHMEAVVKDRWDRFFEPSAYLNVTGWRNESTDCDRVHTWRNTALNFTLFSIGSNLCVAWIGLMLPRHL